MLSLSALNEGWAQLTVFVASSSFFLSTDRRGWSLLPLFLELEYPADFSSSSSIKVDVILPPNTSLHCAHDLGEVMQTAIEALESVSRAYVHLDYSSRNP